MKRSPPAETVAIVPSKKPKVDDTEKLASPENEEESPTEVGSIGEEDNEAKASEDKDNSGREHGAGEQVPPGRLLFSALTWDGRAVEVCVEGANLDEYVGAYRQGTLPSPYRLKGWDAIHEAHEYVPCSTPLEFKYTREAYMGTLDHVDSFLVADQISPLMRIAANEELNPWTGTFKDYVYREQDSAPYANDGGDAPTLEDRPLAGPPFYFFECDCVKDGDFKPGDLADAKTIAIDQPDLPRQTKADKAIYDWSKRS